MKLKSLLFFSLIVGGIYSCSEADQEIEKTSEKLEMSLKTTSIDEEMLKDAILEMTEMMKVITVNDADAYEELFQLLKSGFYLEPYVGLFELLDPDNAIIYQHIPISSQLKGSFKTAFERELAANPSLYPNLATISQRRIGGTTSNPSLSGLDKFFNEAGIAFYVPYMTNESDVEFQLNDDPTIVPAITDADSALGYLLTDHGWDDVTTDDEYGEQFFTIIVEPNNYAPCDGSNSSFAAPISTSFVASVQSSVPCVGEDYGWSPPENPTSNVYTGQCSHLEPGQGYVRQVFIGHCKINNKRQYDRWISFTGNGGGSEIRIGRLDSRSHIPIDSTGNITATEWDNVISVYFSRKDIRKGNKIWAGSVWHENWQCAGTTHEALFGTWEEDTEGNIVFDQTISFNGDELFSVDATIQNRSKDEIIRIWVREKTEFFATNLLDQGGGTWTGEHSFSDRNWGIYDVGTNFSYTMPHRWVLYNN